jgi:hypothetical protein
VGWTKKKSSSTVGPALALLITMGLVAPSRPGGLLLEVELSCSCLEGIRRLSCLNSGGRTRTSRDSIVVATEEIGDVAVAESSVRRDLALDGLLDCE